MAVGDTFGGVGGIQGENSYCDIHVKVRERGADDAYRFNMKYSGN